MQKDYNIPPIQLQALALCTLIAGSAASSEIPKLKRQAITSAVWVILISFPLMVYQVIIVIMRLRNVHFLNTYFIVFAVVVSLSHILRLSYNIYCNC